MAEIPGVTYFLVPNSEGSAQWRALNEVGPDSKLIGRGFFVPQTPGLSQQFQIPAVYEYLKGNPLAEGYIESYEKFKHVDQEAESIVREDFNPMAVLMLINGYSNKE